MVRLEYRVSIRASIIVGFTVSFLARVSDQCVQNKMYACISNTTNMQWLPRLYAKYFIKANWYHMTSAASGGVSTQWLVMGTTYWHNSHRCNASSLRAFNSISSCCNSDWWAAVSLSLSSSAACFSSWISLIRASRCFTDSSTTCNLHTVSA